MGRRFHSIPVPFFMWLGPNNDPLVETTLCNWEDGGENKPIHGWYGVGWAYDVTRGRNTVYALAVQKNPPQVPNEDGMPDEFVYDEDKLVFIVTMEDPEYTYAFSFKKKVLKEFRKDHGYNGEIEKDTVAEQYI